MASEASLSTTLWLNLFLGPFGVDRLYADAPLGFLKLVLGILLLPLAMLWNLLDTLCLLAFRAFAFAAPGGGVRWAKEDAGYLRRTVVAVVMLHLLFLGLSTLAAHETARRWSVIVKDE